MRLAFVLRRNWLAVMTFVILLANLPSGGQTFTQLKSFGILTNLTGTTPRSQLVLAPDGMLYGTLSEGSGLVQGSVFKMRTNGADFSVLKQFTHRQDGANPKSALLLDGDVLYGTTSAGGKENGGTIFKLRTDGSDFIVLKSLPGGSYDRNLPPNGLVFGIEDANPPMGGLTLSGTTLFGTTRSGGMAARGSIYRLNTDGSGFQVIKEFNGQDGAAPTGDLVVADHVLFGTTSFGGSSDVGTVFRVATDGSDSAVLKEFTGPDGDRPYAGLTLLDGVLFGVTRAGGGLRGNAGTVFRINPDGSDFTVLKSFGGIGESSFHGRGPTGRLTVRAGVLYGTAGTFLRLTAWHGTVFKINPDGSDFSVIVDSRGTFGNPPFQSPAGLVLDGDFAYGVTADLAWQPPWTVFRVNLSTRDKTTLRVFNSGSGDVSRPDSLVMKDGVFYGTTTWGGISNQGTVFKINGDGGNFGILKSLNDSGGHSYLTLIDETLYGVRGIAFELGLDGSGYSELHPFSASDGYSPSSPLIEAGGFFYGVNRDGGANDAYGTVFRMNTNGGDFTILRTFAGGPEGDSPSALILLGGELYGATTSRGIGNPGTLFRMKTNGSDLVVLHPFESEIARPGSHIALTSAGDAIYGLISTNLFKFETNGGGLKILARLPARYNFQAGYLLAQGRTLYGVAGDTVFRINTDGTGLHILKRFTNPLDGQPNPGWVFWNDSLYGTTGTGGLTGEGSIFRIDLQPRLTVENQRPDFTLTWPAYAEEYVLEQSEVLTTQTWTPVPGSSVQEGDRRRMRISQPNSSRQNFYRLKKE